jgi:hypothetical protein
MTPQTSRAQPAKSTLDRRIGKRPARLARHRPDTCQAQIPPSAAGFGALVSRIDCASEPRFWTNPQFAKRGGDDDPLPGVVALERHNGRNPTRMYRREEVDMGSSNGMVWRCCIAAIAVTMGVAWADENKILVKIKELGIPSLNGTTPVYYSLRHRQHAEQLQIAIDDMNAFFKERLDVRTNVVLALLDSKGWSDVFGRPYGLPTVIEGTPPVIVMPATSGSPAFSLMMARKEAIPQETLKTFLKENDTTFEAVADQFVDLIGFHELGHTLTTNLGIDPKNHWLDEFLATYWSYAYISERQPKWKRVFDLLGRPSKARPKNTSLEDLERLYNRVDDYGWYQGMFEAGSRELYPALGLKFLSDLRREFPKAVNSPDFLPVGTRMKPGEVLTRLEKIAPRFQKWAAAFSTSPQQDSPK